MIAVQVTLAALGFDAAEEAALQALSDPALYPARVSSIHKGGFEILSARGTEQARLFGTLKHRFRQDPAARPAVGDWVAVRPQGEATPGIAAVLPRRSAFIRRAAGRRAEPQVVVTNVDTVFLVVGLDVDVSVRRAERYLATIWESGAQPVLVLNKGDLVAKLGAEGEAHLADVRAELAAVASEVPTLVTSGKAPADAAALLRPYLAPGRTVALVGSSGVGKSTLANALLGAPLLATRKVRERDGRGQHTTTRRALFPIPDLEGRPFGLGMLIDTPGMRELALWNVEEGLSELFADIIALADTCRFTDCAHRLEPGCAVREAILQEELDPDRLESYCKLAAEQATQEERARRR
ncbi:MAG: ribosome small subunit-dependent GTPase A [Myxococcales bacterium]|nr:ribosome small subunit-dependent GTPase A [Myxococcales bacterium]